MIELTKQSSQTKQNKSNKLNLFNIGALLKFSKVEKAVINPAVSSSEGLDPDQQELKSLKKLKTDLLSFLFKKENLL